MTSPAYIPFEDEAAVIRRCLRAIGRTLQQQGEIPSEVPETEIDAEMEKYVPQFVSALHRSPLYFHLKEHPDHLEAHIWELLTSSGLPGASI
jgi:hypothetical protein